MTARAGPLRVCAYPMLLSHDPAASTAPDLPISARNVRRLRVGLMALSPTFGAEGVLARAARRIIAVAEALSNDGVSNNVGFPCRTRLAGSFWVWRHNPWRAGAV
jgi:hypothetical protein